LFSSHSLVSQSNGACVGLAFALALWHCHCHYKIKKLIVFRIHQPGLNGVEYLLSMIGSSFSHSGWLHLSNNILVLLLSQLRPCPSADTWKSAWDSPLMFVMLFFGGCVAGSAAEILVAAKYKRLVHARTASAADAVKQSLSCRLPVCIPVLSKVWNSVAAFAANRIAAWHTLPEHMLVLIHSRRGHLGASDGIAAVSAVAAVRGILEIFEHGEREPAALHNVIPLSLFAVQCGTDIRFSLARFSGNFTEDSVGHVGHLGGAAFGLAVAALAPLAAAAARSLARARAKAQPPPPTAPTRASMSLW
jgi:hypothetical protein